MSVKCGRQGFSFTVDKMEKLSRSGESNFYTYEAFPACGMLSGVVHLDGW